MKTDYHCHILPGLDDGAQSREEAVCLAGNWLDGDFSVLFVLPISLIFIGILPG